MLLIDPDSYSDAFEEKNLAVSPFLVTDDEDVTSLAALLYGSYRVMAIVIARPPPAAAARVAVV